MFEIAIFCVILFAIGYWTTLFIMGRREDVLHGEFVETDAATADSAPVPVSPVPTRPRVLQPAAPVAKEALVPEAPAPAPALSPLPSANPERLQSLLASIKQELKNAAKI
jgi:hypothetical protein